MWSCSKFVGGNKDNVQINSEINYFCICGYNWLCDCTVRLLIHVLRQPTFFFSSLFLAIFVDLPRSCLVRTWIT